MDSKKLFSDLSSKEKVIIYITIGIAALSLLLSAFSAVCLYKAQKEIQNLSKQSQAEEVADNTVSFVNPTESKPSQTAESTTAATKSSDTFENSEIREYVINTNSKRIHTPDCPSAIQTLPKNKQTVEWDEEDYNNALSEGYVPCGVCNAGR